MNADRADFEASVIASLIRVHGLSRDSAAGAVAEIEDVWALGLPAEDAAALLARALKLGERRLRHMGV